MIGKVKVVTEGEYQKWLEAAQGASEGQSLADYGKQLYQSRACITRHSIDGTPGTAPSFLHIYGEKANFEDGSSLVVDENYIRESILNPRAKIVKGFQPVMPTFQGMLNDVQLNALVAFIKSLGENQSSEQSESKSE